MKMVKVILTKEQKEKIKSMMHEPPNPELAAYLKEILPEDFKIVLRCRYKNCQHTNFPLPHITHMIKHHGIPLSKVLDSYIESDFPDSYEVPAGCK